MTLPFGARLHRAAASSGRLVAGIDPHASLLAAWGLPDSADGLRSFALTCVEAFAGAVAAVKPQSAFFERHGAAGIAALEDCLAAARDAGLLTILDVKRGDIGSTMGAYADAYLRDGAPLAADAITVSPYLGVGSLSPALDLAEASGRGVFVLALTSNPEGHEVQWARGERGEVAADVLAQLAARNASRASKSGADGVETSAPAPLGSIGAVIGATTVASAPFDLGLGSLGGPILAPGVGAQGARAEDLSGLFGDESFVLASSSRDILGAGPDPVALRKKAAAQAATLPV